MSDFSFGLVTTTAVAKGGCQKQNPSLGDLSEGSQWVLSERQRRRWRRRTAVTEVGWYRGLGNRTTSWSRVFQKCLCLFSYLNSNATSETVTWKHRDVSPRRGLPECMGEVETAAAAEALRAAANVPAAEGGPPPFFRLKDLRRVSMVGPAAIPLPRSFGVASDNCVDEAVDVLVLPVVPPGLRVVRALGDFVISCLLAGVCSASAAAHRRRQKQTTRRSRGGKESG